MPEGMVGIYSNTISKSLYRINRNVHPDSVGAVLRCTRPNAICIPNRTGHNQKQQTFLREIVNRNWYKFL